MSRSCGSRILVQGRDSTDHTRYKTGFACKILIPDPQESNFRAQHQFALTYFCMSFELFSSANAFSFHLLRITFYPTRPISHPTSYRIAQPPPPTIYHAFLRVLGPHERGDRLLLLPHHTYFQNPTPPHPIGHPTSDQTLFPSHTTPPTPHPIT